MTPQNPAAPSPAPPIAIRRQLTRALIVGSLGLCIVIAIALWLMLRAELHELMDRELTQSAELIHNILSNTHPDETLTLAQVPESEYTEHLAWQLVDVATATVVQHSLNAPTTAWSHTSSLQSQISQDGNWHWIALPFRHQNNHVLVVAQPMEEFNETLQEALSSMASVTAVACFFGLLFMNWRMRIELQPLQTLSQAVSRYDPLQPHSSPPASQRMELRPIEQAIQDLGQRLSQRLVREQAFTSHAAHALLTPVAGLDAQLAVALRGAPDDIRPRLLKARAAANRLSRAMQALLGLFRSGAEPQRQTVALHTLFDPDNFTPLTIQGDTDAQVSIDPDLLSPALYNLFDNAARHHADSLSLHLSQARIGGVEHHQLTLHDNGEGCPAAQLATMQLALQAQNYRPDSGLRGLGLILADLVMRAHGGHLALVAAERGFVVVLSWPVKNP